MKIPKMNATRPLVIQPGQMKGLYQGLDENLMHYSYSPDCQNIDVSEGIISTRKGSTRLPTANLPSGYRVGSIFFFPSTVTGYYYLIVGVWVVSHSQGPLYEWYYIRTGEATDASWTKLTIKSSGGAAMTGVNPRTAQSVLTQISGTTVLVVAGESPPMKVYYDSEDIKLYVLELGGSPGTADTITFHRDRVWLGIGEVVKYCNAFDPEDWGTALETGSWTIDTPDNDSIIQIINLLDSVVIFKENTVWRIGGSIPSEYNKEQVYSVKGTPHVCSVCSDGNFCFFAGSDGIYQYTGDQAIPILTKEIEDTYKGMGSVKCTIRNEKLYVWSYNDYYTSSNYKTIVYDTRSKKIEVLHDYCLVGQVVGDTVYYGKGNEPEVYKLDDSLKFGSNNINAYWYTPESDFGLPNASKTLTDIYFNAWGTKADGTAGGQIKVTVYYNETGTQKSKTKTVTMQLNKKTHNLQFTVAGRLFKFKFENVDGSAMHISGLKILFDVNED